MALAIRDVRSRDIDAVIALNNATPDSIAGIDRAQLEHLYEVADYFRIAEVDQQLAGFLIALNADAAHSSVHFRWFRERYASFMYIDRIVVANRYRRHGLGRVFYADVQSFSEPRVPLLTCSVRLEPRNDVALLFHGTYGFQELGQGVEPGNHHRVSLLGKNLTCHEFVRQRYGDEETDLPDQPWLTGRLQRGHHDTPAAHGKCA